MAASTCKPCRKRTFLDEPSALVAAVRNAGKFGARYRTYACPQGNGYHLTTKPEREKMTATPARQAVTVPPTSQRHATHAEQRHLLDAAGDHLGLLARLGRAVDLARLADQADYLAAQVTLIDAAKRLIPYLVMHPCELEAVLKLTGIELGRRGFTGYPHTTTTPEGSKP
jgi:hypothetical protein